MINPTSSSEFYHFPVMLDEVIKICSPDKGGTYIDCTFGGGGYSKKLLKFSKTKVIALDRDEFITKISKDLEKKYSFVGIILGLPINMNGTEGPRCQSTRSFATKLSQITNHFICLWDERLSTLAAEKSLISSDISRKSRANSSFKIIAPIGNNPAVKHFDEIITSGSKL